MTERLRIFIIEDDIDCATSLAFQVEELGHQAVGVVRSGSEALAAVVAVEPDLVLLDLGLPDLDGIEVCRRLMATRPMPIVMVTGVSDRQLVADAVAAGACGYVVKPPESRQLEAAIAMSQARFRRGSQLLEGDLALTREVPVLDMPNSKEDSPIAPGDRPLPTGPASSIRRVDVDGVSPHRTTRIRVVAISDYPLVAQALAAVVHEDNELEMTGIVTDPERASELVFGTRPNVILLAFSEVNDEWPKHTAILHARFPESRILLLAPSLDPKLLSDCVQCGAIGYLGKDCPPAELTQAIKRAHAGEVLIPAHMLVSLFQQLRPARHEADVRPVTRTSARRGFEVLQAIAAGMSNPEVAAHLGISVHTVRSHIKDMMARLGARTKLEAVIIALREGLIELPH